MTCTTAPDLTGLMGSAFLDVHGRFAKHPDQVAIVRIYFEGSSFDLSAADFRRLSDAQKLAIEESGSGAGMVNTVGVSNA